MSRICCLVVKTFFLVSTKYENNFVDFRQTVICIFDLIEMFLFPVGSGWFAGNLARPSSYFPWKFHRMITFNQTHRLLDQRIFNDFMFWNQPKMTEIFRILTTSKRVTLRELDDGIDFIIHDFNVRFCHLSTLDELCASKLSNH